MDLSPTHLHLLLNHFPTIGFLIGLALFLVAHFWGGHQHLKQAALVTFVGVAILTIPTYTTGNAAQEALAKTPSVSSALMRMHEGAALAATLAVEFTGFVAWIALWQLRRLGSVPRATSLVVLSLAILTFALTSRAAALGGEIRHPEISVTAETSQESLAQVVGTFVRETPWAWVTSETLHFIGLSLLIGVTVFIDLSFLGVLAAETRATLDRLLPWAILGFGLNTLTGMLFFVSAPAQYTANPAFYWKLGFVLVACVNTLYFTFDDALLSDANATVSLTSKTFALSALVLWVGAMFWGSMLPFIGNAF